MSKYKKWEIEPHDRSCKEFAISDKWSEVCKIDYDDVDHKDQDRLAKFIASAPLMYKAIQNLRHSKEGDMLDDEFQVELTKAIKAGEKYFGSFDKQ